ncbi:MAG: hypothetical protein CM1200mP22_25550 [Dehalococcoidia bacterium]|nr:MAG: hypothetical protein CM1200mP22_25550 [Dehalococcoidia bacterium]
MTVQLLRSPRRFTSASLLQSVCSGEGRTWVIEAPLLGRVTEPPDTYQVVIVGDNVREYNLWGFSAVEAATALAAVAVNVALAEKAVPFAIVTV